ncbi:glycosyltransferase family 1 protein, partial [Morganella morganii]|nr:glycosyltransferase family 1 protein [Morganella morganii]
MTTSMCIKKIIVFATTAREMGALSILKDFIQQISNTTYGYSIIVPPELENNLPVISNINYIYIDTSSWLKRIIYDSWKYPLLEIEKYDLCINFQNIPIRTKIKQIVYYHQSLPLSKIKLSPFKKRTLKLWLYKNFYGLFFLKNKKYLTHLIVQAKWIKNSIHSQYSIDSNIITVMKPKVTFPSISELEKNTIDTDLNNGKIIFFYPASDYEYKNHTIIINAISKIPKKLRDKILII